MGKPSEWVRVRRGWLEDKITRGQLNSGGMTTVAQVCRGVVMASSPCVPVEQAVGAVRTAYHFGADVVAITGQAMSTEVESGLADVDRILDAVLAKARELAGEGGDE